VKRAGVLLMILAMALRASEGWTERTFDEPSVEGRPLAWRALGADDAPAVLLLGGIHGDEPMGTRLLERFAAELEPVAGKRVVIAAACNPDGLARGTRENARDVDLNRNFRAASWTRGGKRGRAPLCEPESRFVAHLVETLRPTHVVTVHAPFRCVNWDGPAEALARLMGDANGYELRPSIGYPTPGSLGSWVGHDLSIPIVTLELPRGEAEDGFLRENRAALMAALRWSP
jgi:murein peptide amidase A